MDRVNLNPYVILIACLFYLFGCSLKLGPVSERVIKQANPHLKYEMDSLNDFLLYKGFVVQYNKANRVPNYTIHRITPKQLKDSSGFYASRKKSPDFVVDNRLIGKSAMKSDYYKSGYDRGHHVPAGDFVYSQNLKDETFTYSNVSPQTPQLNRYAWKYLEEAIRIRVKKCNCSAYVVTGSHFKSESKTIGKNVVGIPDQLYKIIFYPDRAKMYAFQMNNDTTNYQKKIRKYQLSVDELERQTGYDFFEQLFDEDEMKLESELRRFRK